MKRNKRKIFSIVLMILLVVGSGTAILSYFLAKAADGDNNTTTVSAASNIYTNIDYIIDNSNDTDNPSTDDFDETVYHIVEISSGKKGTFSTMYSIDAESGTVYGGQDGTTPVSTDIMEWFRKLVIDAHKTSVTSNMAEKKIQYVAYNIDDINNFDSVNMAAQKAIMNADLVYVSMDPKKMYSEDRDFTEGLYSQLNLYATTQKKPLIIDSPTKTSAIANHSVNTYNTLVNEMSETGNSKNTFAWDSDSNADTYKYFLHQNGSWFMPINGTKRQSYWKKTYKLVEVEKEVAVFEIQYEPERDADGNIVYDADGNIVYKVDGEGNKIPIYQKKTDPMIDPATGDPVTDPTTGEMVYENVLDPITGEPIPLLAYDEETGLPIPVIDDEGNIVTEKKKYLTIVEDKREEGDDKSYARIVTVVDDNVTDDYNPAIQDAIINAPGHELVQDADSDNVIIPNQAINPILYYDVEIDDKGNYKYEVVRDENGNLVYKTDADGNPIPERDADGNIIYYADETGYHYKTDETNNNTEHYIYLDHDGNVVDNSVVIDENNYAVEKNFDDGRVYLYEYSLDGSGQKIKKQLVIDGVPQVEEDGTTPIYECEHDDQGNVIYEEDGVTPKYVYEHAADYIYERARQESYEILTRPVVKQYELMDNGLVCNGSTDGNGDKIYDELPVYQIIKPTSDNEGSALYNAYQLGTVHPDYVVFSTVKYNALDPNKRFTNSGSAAPLITLNDYDMIILDNSLNGRTITDGSEDPEVDDYQLFIDTMDNLNHIIYDSSLYTGQGSGGEIELDAELFMKLYKDVVNKEKPRFGSVMVSSKKIMDTITSAYNDYSDEKINEYLDEISLNTPFADEDERKAAFDARKKAIEDRVMDIVDIINAAKYRSNSSNGDSSSTYTVLEIQPGAPVDLELAKLMNGKFTIYSKPENHTNRIDADYYYYAGETGKEGGTSDLMYHSLDEITYDGRNSVASIKNVDGSFSNTTWVNSNNQNFQDYYTWEWSAAKVLHLLRQTDMEKYGSYTMDNVKVVHMTAQEFQASKLTLADNFDLIYIGGDNSGIKDTSHFFANANVQGQGGKLADNATYYNMYYHNGDLYRYPSGTYGSDKGTVGIYYGNDFTLDRYDELIKYVQTGMPVVISSELTAAYTEMSNARNKGTQYTLHTLDPDSRVTKFLDSVSSTANTNVIWNFNAKDTVTVDNTSGTYTRTGIPTYSGFVTVFGGMEANDVKTNKAYVSRSNNGVINEAGLVQKLKSSKDRPKFQAKTDMKEYYYLGGPERDVLKPDSWPSRDLQFEWNMLSEDPDYLKNITMNLYVDDNGDSRFDENELVQSEPATNKRLNWSVDESFSGGVFMKLEAEDGTHCKASRTYMIKIQPPESDKTRINILQILPENATTTGSESQNTKATLQFCVECQLGGDTLDGNGSVNGQGYYKYDEGVLQSNSDGFQDRPTVKSTNHLSNYQGVATIESKIEAYDKTAVVYDTQYRIVNGEIQKDNQGNPIEDDLDTSFELDPQLPNGTNPLQYKKVANQLGVHNHQFGIAYYSNTVPYKGRHTGADDYSYNWADELEDDYDFDMNIWTTREYEDRVAMIKYAYQYSAQFDKDVEYTRSKYSNKASDYETYFKFMDMLLNDSSSVYVPYQLYDFTNKVDNFGNLPDEVINGATVNANEQLVSEISDMFTRNNISGYVNINTSADKKAAIRTNIARLQSELGITDAQMTAFLKELEDYGFEPQDHKSFAYTLSSMNISEKDIISYAKSQNSLDDFCDDLLAKTNNGTVKVFDRNSTADVEYKEILSWKHYHNYYFFYSMYSNDTNKCNEPEFAKRYVVWRDAKIVQKYFYNKYLNYKMLSSVDDDGTVNLKEVFSIIIIGPAEKFCGDDIYPDPKDGQHLATDALKTYTNAGGKIFLFHDTINDGTGGNSRYMTEDLREIFGQDARPVHEVSASKLDVNKRNFTISFAGNTFTTTQGMQASDAEGEYVFGATVSAPGNNVKTHVYILQEAPSAGDTINVGNYNVVKLGPYSNTTDSLIYSARINPNGGNNNNQGVFNASERTTNNGGTDFNITLNITPIDWNGNPSNATLYAVVYHGDINSDQTYVNGALNLPKSKCEVIKIDSDSVTNSTSKAIFNVRSSLSAITPGRLAQTDDGQKVIVSVNGSYSSLIGKSVSLYDPESKKTYSAVFKNGTDRNDNPAAVATFDIQNWKPDPNASVDYAANNGDDDRYYVSTLATDGSNTVKNGNTKVGIVTEAFSDYEAGYQEKGNWMLYGTSMYNFAYWDKQYQETSNPWSRNIAHDDSNHMDASRKCTQINESRLTKYPFTLQGDFKISGTHSSAYCVDVESKDMVVYYTVAGDTGRNGLNGAFYASSPNNGANNYFLYQYNNVTFCNAGHRSITGFGAENNDERKLYINVICNQLTKSAIGTQVKLYDNEATADAVRNGTANDKIVPDGLGNYTFNAKSTTDNPFFSYNIKVDESAGVKVKRVQAYFDLDVTANGSDHAFDYPKHWETDDELASHNMKITDYANEDSERLARKGWYTSTNLADSLDGSGNVFNDDLVSDSLIQYRRTTNNGKVTSIDRNYRGVAIDNDISTVVDAGVDDSNKHILVYDTGVAENGIQYGETPVSVNNGNIATYNKKVTVDGNGESYISGSNIQLRPEYFDAYGGAHTYIVVHVTTEKNGKEYHIYRRIKILINPDMFDLT